MVNAAMALETNLLFDYLPSSIEPSSEGSSEASSEAVSSLFAGNSNLLTSKQIGQRLLYSFHVKVISDDCLDLSTSINQDLCLAEFPKYSSSSPLVCRAQFSVKPLRPWKRRKSFYLDALTAKVVGRHVQCKIEDKWRTMVQSV